MDYRPMAADELRRLPELRSAYENTQAHIHELDRQLRSVPSSCPADGLPRRGRSGSPEDRLAALLCKKEELTARLSLIRSRTERLSRAMDILGPEERAVLEAFFTDGACKPEDTAEKLGMEKSALYRLRSEALEKLTRALFGVVIL